jgi:hypothetical protein
METTTKQPQAEIAPNNQTVGVAEEESTDHWKRLSSGRTPR